MIKNLKSDFTSVFIVSNVLVKSIEQAISDGLESVAVCGLGIDDGDLDPIMVANLTFSICKRYDKKFDIRIIDENKLFIDELKKIVKK